MPPRSKKRYAGVGATGLVATHFIHPSQHVRDKFPNRDKTWKQQNKTKFYLTGKATRVINRKSKQVFTFTSEDFEGVDELYAVCSHFIIHELGHANEYFAQVPVAVERPVGGDGQILLPTLPVANHTPGEDAFTREQIDAMLAEQITVDDDNAPAPENIPRPQTGDGVLYDEWGHKGIDYRRRGSGTMENPSMKSFPIESLQSMLRGSYFINYFPMLYMRKMLLTINEQLDPSHTPIEYWEFLRWIGIWFLLATVKGYPKRKFTI